MPMLNISPIISEHLGVSLTDLPACCTLLLEDGRMTSAFKSLTHDKLV